ncbi:unnamed protein product [Adineta ricciae]|uniref:Nuclear envelope membrane protein n=1 Tax=Adineta ricciae TaxID=249248 RepID=A0A815CUT2_ADIRI|nr:unnamed protein product [Adineta ricciae]
MNWLARSIWLLFNIFFGAPPATLVFSWVACDLQLPLVIIEPISSYLPILKTLFNVPYVHINEFSSSVSAKLLFNAFLYAIFGTVHTLFAQEFMQVILRRFLFPKETLRTVYCILTTITVIILVGFWQHTHIQLWNWLPGTMDIYQQQRVLLLLFLLFFSPGSYVILKFNPLEFCGVNQIFSKSKNGSCPYASSEESEKRTSGNETLVTGGLFRLCRHPLYFFTILAWLITPVMSLDRLAFIAYTCLYALIGIHFEERKLVQIFGESYVKYQQHVPSIIPSFRRKAKEL